MNFTREPIIETIISPKEGHKLVIRSSKGTTQEEFFVDAIEVVSFGNHCFYRSMEKPKAFVVPVTDYEVIEVRETKVVLKMPGVEKGGIKIGGGREAPMKAPAKEEEAEEPREKRRDKKRFRKKREREEVAAVPAEGETKPEEPMKLRELIPPPSTLISETISRYKEVPHYAGVFVEKEESVVEFEESEGMPPPENEE